MKVLVATARTQGARDNDYNHAVQAGYAGYSNWPILEGHYTLYVLFEYATIGLIDISYTDPAGARDDFRGNWGASVSTA